MLQQLYVADQQYVYARTTATASVVVAINNDVSPATWSTTLAGTRIPPNAVLTDRLGVVGSVTVSGGVTTLSLPARSAATSHGALMQKPHLSFWQIWNMSFGFLGIQFGWGLQLGNMSAIYEKLGAQPDRLPLLWLAAPLTGLIVQPIIGSLSDRTWGPLGRRRPYFLVGAILASTALFFMPTSSSLWMAAGLLWILDASINVSMEPFRAFVADKLNERQRVTGFVMQSFFIGLGATFAGTLPIAFRHLGVTGTTASGIPLTVKYSFQLGARGISSRRALDRCHQPRISAGRSGRLSADEGARAGASPPARTRFWLRSARCP